MKRIPGPSEAMVTYTVKPKPEVEAGLAEALEAVEQAKTAKGAKQEAALEQAAVLLAALQAQHPKDPRIARLLDTARSIQGLRGDGGATSIKAVRAAFHNLAEQAKTLQAAAASTERITKVSGGTVSDFDRRMMRAAVKLAERPLSENNTPAATILSLQGKIVSIGQNRAYAPLHDWRRHGEMEAMGALTQRTYSGMANVLIRFRDSGGALSPELLATLAKLERQGVKDDPGFIDTAATLKKGGFFSPQKIASYGAALQAFVSEGGFMRDEEGKLHPRHAEVLRSALAEGTIQKSDLADWSAFDQLRDGSGAAKMDLYTSLEPCGMCMQNCTSQGHMGRVLYAAQDPYGGGVSTLPHYADLYFKAERVPFEIIGGVEEEARAQAMYEHFFREIYPKAKAGAAG